MRKASSRDVAFSALVEWRAGKKFADVILNERLESTGLSVPDRGFATELFYGVLRHRTLLDFWIGELRSGHLDHDSRDLIRLGLYQLFHLEMPPHAAIYETVEVAPRKKRPLINGVLRNADRKRDDLQLKANAQDLSVRQSHPQFLIDRWTESFGAEETETLCRWNNQPAPIYARLNRLKLSDAEFFSKYSDAERIQENFVRLRSIPQKAIAAGHCYIQDPSTIAACLLLNPQPGDNVLDACAVPGGKTGYLAELMKNTGFILACDRDDQRVGTLRDNLERLGVTIARVARHDWTRQSLSDWKTFDRILVDAPCTNTGVMRRRIDVRWRLTPEDFSRMPVQQLKILGATVPLLKPGGVLVYSTCSLEPEENQHVVERLLREFSFLKLIEEKSILPFRDGFDGAYAAKLIRE